MNRRERRVAAKLGQASPMAAPAVVPGVADVFAAGAGHHQAGRLAEAEGCYRRVLAAQPSHADALHMLGVLAHQVGRADAAVALIRQAIDNNANNSAYFSNLGCALQNQGSLDEAAAAFRQAIRLDPQLAQAHCNLGNLLKNRGQLDEAITACRQAIRLKPDLAEAHCNLGAALQGQGKFDEAAASYHQALRIKPDYAEAHGNLGVVLSNQGRLEESAAACRHAIRLKPDHAAAHCTLGRVLHDQGKFNEAIAACREAIRTAPDLAEAHSVLGASLRGSGNLDEAVAACRQSIRIDPGEAGAHCNLGLALRDQNKLDEAAAAFRDAIRLKPDMAVACGDLANVLSEQRRLAEAVALYRQAIRIDPDFAEAHFNLGNALRDQDRFDEAVAAFREAIRIKPDLAVAYDGLATALYGQEKFDEAAAAHRQAADLKLDFDEAAGSTFLFGLNYSGGFSSAALFTAHRAWDERHGRPLSHPVAHVNDRGVARRLKVGYVSPDFRQHSVAYFLEPLLRNHDRTAVEVFCYAEVGAPDAVTERFKQLAGHWVATVGMPDAALAERIRRDGIDILVDLAGHTAKNRLLVFARKPAPVQVTWLGYPNTTGLKAIDYRLVDAVTDPEGEADAHASETLVRLAGGFLCYEGPVDAPEPAVPPCLAAGAVTFGSFNSAKKLSQRTLEAWAALLARLPAARLLLKGRAFADEGTRAACLDRLGECGVAAERVDLIAWLPESEHLATYGRLDIALDPFPYNGATTTCEALWMGVPVVTLRGDRHAGRVGASLLTRLGLTDLIAGSIEAYVETAAALAGDPARLADLRRSLRPRMAASPLCDAPAFARKIEAAYRTMWRRWAEAPGDASVEAAAEVGRAPDNPPGNTTAIDTADIAEVFKAGIMHHQAGKLAEAEGCYRQVLAAKPKHADALNMLGVLAHQAGRPDMAVVLIRQAIESDPGNPGYFSNLAYTLRHQGNLHEAAAAARQAIRLKPDLAAAHFNLGCALHDDGELDKAAAAYREAVRIDPALAGAYCNLGNILRDRGKLDEAVAACREAIRLDPNLAPAYCNLGTALQDQGNLEEAIAAYVQAIGLKPDMAEGYYNLGSALYHQGKLDDAITANGQAIRLKPDYAEAYSNIGSVLRDQGRLDEAVRACREAIRLKPQHPDAHLNLGAALYDQGRLAEAVASCRQAIVLKPDFVAPHSNLLMCLNYDESVSAATLFDAHRGWDERHARPVLRPVDHANGRSAERRLKVGYVSADFRSHSVAHFLEPLLRSHDRRAIEVFCYAEVNWPDARTERFRQMADHWVSTVGMSDEAVAQRIRTDGVDILVDLAGHTAKGRLLVFARKPAPVQVTWLGYPNTTGLTAIDYRLVDAVTDPPGEADSFASETLVRLPGGFLCYDGPADAPATGAPRCLASGTVTFGSFNSAAKLSEATLDAWAALLTRLPAARLLLKSKAFADEGTRAFYLDRLSARGVTAQRVDLVAWLPEPDHLAAYGRVDIALDPFPYNGTTTTCEALWMGVPVVALRGDRHAGRVGASLLTQLGETDLIAGSVEEYVETAVALAGDPARLADLRRLLRPRMAASPLCDAAAFARKIEAAYRAMWKDWCQPAADAPAARLSTAAKVQGITADSPRYLLIKSWGCGFWSDTSQVLGCLLLAEATSRIPVVHWGRNSLFRGAADDDAFKRYFESISVVTIHHLSKMEDADCFPPKWSRDNLLSEDVAKWEGMHSRMAAFDYLRRPEAIAVCDFYVGVIDVVPWIPAGHPMHDKPLWEVYQYLIAKYLRPSAAVLSRVEAFFNRHLQGMPYVSVHLRGADKGKEDRTLESSNNACLAALETVDPSWRILVLTDDEHWLARARAAYGNRVVATDCRRTSTQTGVHLDVSGDGAHLGLEIMTDTYLALRGNKFIGNGRSNVAAMISCLRDWPADDCVLVKPPVLTELNWSIRIRPERGDGT